MRDNYYLKSNEEPSSLFFIDHNANKEIIKITKDGDFYINGRKVETDQEIREGFRSWLKSMGHIK